MNYHILHQARICYAANICDAHVGCHELLTQLGALILRMRGGAKHSPHMRTRQIHLKTTKINDLENEPRHVWRLPKVSGITKDEI